MMTEANKDSIDSHVAKWKEKVAPGAKMNWVYIGGAAVIIFLIVAYFLKGKKKPVKRIENNEEDQL